MTCSPVSWIRSSTQGSDWFNNFMPCTRASISPVQWRHKTTVKVMVWTLAVLLLTQVSLVTSSALQSQNWQLTGISYCYHIVLCSHSLSTLIDKWTHSAASRHTTTPVSCKMPSPRSTLTKLPHISSSQQLVMTYQDCNNVIMFMPTIGTFGHMISDHISDRHWTRAELQNTCLSGANIYLRT